MLQYLIQQGKAVSKYPKLVTDSLELFSLIDKIPDKYLHEDCKDVYKRQVIFFTSPSESTLLCPVIVMPPSVCKVVSVSPFGSTETTAFSAALVPAPS